MACRPEPVEGVASPGSGLDCAVLQDQYKSVNAAASVQLDSTLATFAGSGDYASLEKTQVGIDALQRDFNLTASQLCKDYDAGRISQPVYEARRHCVERRLAYMRAIEQVGKVAVQLNASEGASFDLGGKLDALLTTLDCEERASASASTVSSEGASFGGSVVSSTGTVLDTGMHLDVSGSGGRFESRDLDVTATLICERKTAEGYAAVPNCEGVELTGGDRFRVAFRTSVAARFYVLMYNGSGQFQVFSPHDRYPDNAAKAFAPQVFPPDRWLVLDAVGGVTERLVLVVSEYAVQELEALRGAEVAPGPEGQLAAQVRQVRGMLEAAVARSGQFKDVVVATDAGSSVLLAGVKGRGRLEPSISRGAGFGDEDAGAAAETWEVEGEKKASVPTLVKTRDVAGVEFSFRHR